MSNDIERAIAKAKEIESKATPGPWNVDTEFCVSKKYASVGDHGDGFYSIEDASLIAHARNTHKLVWDVVERAYQFVNGGTDDMISVSESRIIEALDALARAVLGDSVTEVDSDDTYAEACKKIWAE